MTPVELKIVRAEKTVEPDAHEESNSEVMLAFTLMWMVAFALGVGVGFAIAAVT